MTTKEIGINFRRAEQTIDRLMEVWKKEKWTREQILNQLIIASEATPNGQLMQAFCFAVMAERLIKQTPPPT